MKAVYLTAIVLLALTGTSTSRSNFRTYSRERLKNLKERVSKMFHYAYDGYLNYAYPYDELRPLRCLNRVKLFSLL